MKRLFLLSALSLLVFGCEEDRTPGEPYNRDSYIYFNTVGERAGQDAFDKYAPFHITDDGGIPSRTSSQPYATFDIDVKFDLMPVGRMSKQDRPVKVVFANADAENFPPAEAFEIRCGGEVLSIVNGEIEGLEIPANGAGTPMVVRLLWNKELFLANKGKQWQIVLECCENDYFKPWPETTNGTNSTTGENDGEPYAKFTINFGVSATFS